MQYGKRKIFGAANCRCHKCSIKQDYIGRWRGKKAILSKINFVKIQIDKYFEGIVDVVSGKILAKTAAQRYRLDLEQLNKLVGLVKLKKAESDDEEEDEEEDGWVNGIKNIKIDENEN